MKSREVDTITSNEQHVRMRIFDGDLPIDEAATELLRIERAQHDAERKRHQMTIQRLADAMCAMRTAYDILDKALPKPLDHDTP